MNTTTEKSDAIFANLVAGLERLRKNRDADTNTSPSLSTDLFDAVNARLCKITAIANLLMDTEPAGMAKGSLCNTAWIIVDLVQEAHDLMAGTAEVQS